MSSWNELELMGRHSTLGAYLVKMPDNNLRMMEFILEQQAVDLCEK
jgi:hypothetical protein